MSDRGNAHEQILWKYVFKALPIGRFAVGQKEAKTKRKHTCLSDPPPNITSRALSHFIRILKVLSVRQTVHVESMAIMTPSLSEWVMMLCSSGTDPVRTDLMEASHLPVDIYSWSLLLILCHRDSLPEHSSGGRWEFVRWFFPCEFSS